MDTGKSIAYQTQSQSNRSATKIFINFNENFYIPENVILRSCLSPHMHSVKRRRQREKLLFMAPPPLHWPPHKVYVRVFTKRSFKYNNRSNVVKKIEFHSIFCTFIAEVFGDKYEKVGFPPFECLLVFIIIKSDWNLDWSLCYHACF